MVSARPNLNLEIVVGSAPLVLGLLASILFPSPSQTMAAIKVDGICCPCAVKPLIRELRCIHGVTQVDADVALQEVYVYWNSDLPVRPHDLWNRAHVGRLKPARLASGQQVMTCDKPYFSDMSDSVLP